MVSALVNLLDSADYLVGMRAMDALLVVSALQDEEAAHNAVSGTPMQKVIGQSGKLQKDEFFSLVIARWLYSQERLTSYNFIIFYSYTSNSRFCKKEKSFYA